MTVLSMADRVTEGLSKFQDDGYAVVYAGLDSGALFEFGTLLDTKHPGERNLLDVLALGNSHVRRQYANWHGRC